MIQNADGIKNIAGSSTVTAKTQTFGSLNSDVGWDSASISNTTSGGNQNAYAVGDTCSWNISINSWSTNYGEGVYHTFVFDEQDDNTKLIYVSFIDWSSGHQESWGHAGSGVVVKLENSFDGDNFDEESECELMCCFAAGTMITLANGSTKKIEDINYYVPLEGGGIDYIKTYDMSTGKLENANPIKIETPMHTDFIDVSFDNGIKLTNTPDHGYMVKGKGLSSFLPQASMDAYGYDDVKQLQVGDVCYHYDGVVMQDRIITAIDAKSEDNPVQTYTISSMSTPTGHRSSFIANGIVVNIH